MGADYTFACARVRANERNLLNREKLNIMDQRGIQLWQAIMKQTEPENLLEYTHAHTARV